MDAVELINLYNTLFYASLAVAVLGFGLAAFFFFYFRIPQVRALMTGKARVEMVRQIQEQNAKTGTLRPTLPISGNLGITEETGRTAPQPGYRAPAVQQPETAVLQTNASETMVLGATAAETTILGGSAEGETVLLHQPVNAGVRFEITESTIVIHTNEII